MTKRISIRQKIIRSAMVLAGLWIIYMLLKAILMSIPITRDAILAIGASVVWGKIKEIVGAFLTNIGLAKLGRLKEVIPQLLAKTSPVFGLTWKNVGLLILVAVILFLFRKPVKKVLKVINKFMNPVEQAASAVLKLLRKLNWITQVGTTQRLKSKEIILVRLIKADGSEEMLADLTNGEKTLSNRLTLVPEEGSVSVYAFDHKVMTLNKGADWKRVRETNWFIKLL